MISFNRLANRLAVITCILLIGGMPPLGDCFNIDTKRAVLQTGPKGSAFGYKAEFLQETDSPVSALVSAPKAPVLNQGMSGVHYLCDPTFAKSCDSRSSPPQKEDLTVNRGVLKYPNGSRNGSMFGEKNELFGVALTMANSKTAVICAPLFQDLRFRSNTSFTVGRCQIVPNYNSTQGPSPYTAQPELNYLSQTIMFNGMAMYGFSADGDGAGKVVIGAPFWNVGRGDVSVLDTETRNVIMLNGSTTLTKEPNVFLGYEVTVGKFCRGDTVCFATSNRESLGKVYLIKFEKQSRLPFQTLWEQTGEQAYSSFGAALCAVDLNGDGWSDLLIGAPTYTADVTDSKSYDQGRVYIHISRGESIVGQDNFYAGAMLSGDEVEFARFGSAIANIGDINRDSFIDIAVGAPMENQGSGALYIYLGSSNGPINKHVQKISGQDFKPALRSFGSHISKPTSTISKYGYPDFLVGAPSSDTVVFLQTQLIVNAQIQLYATPNPVDPLNQTCPPLIRLSNNLANGCFSLRYCLNFTYGAKTVIADFNDLDFDLEMELDKRISTESSRRVRLYIEKDATTTTRLNFTKAVPFAAPLCANYSVILRQEQIDRNPFVPLEVAVRFKLNTTKFARGPSPILNQSRPDSQVLQVKFKSKCGNDDQCQADLSLSGKVQHLPGFDNHATFNVINHTRQVEMHLIIHNNRETSYGVALTVNLSGPIEFRTNTGNTTFVCSRHDSDDNNLVAGSVGGPGTGDITTQATTGGSGGTNMKQENRRFLSCNSWSPLGEGEIAEIRLHFIANSVPLEAENKVINFGIKVMPSDPKLNPELKESDNQIHLNSNTVIMADLRITGWSDPRMLYVQNSDNAEAVLTHKLLVNNRGPSFLPPTHLKVSLPATSQDGNDLIGLANVTVTLPSGKVLECSQVSSTGSILDPSYSTELSTATTTTTTTTTTHAPTTSKSSVDNGGGESTTEFSFPDSDTVKRRRREADEMKDATADSTGGSKMDCQTYRCRLYQCRLPALQPNDQLELNVTVSLLRSAISFPEDIDTLLYTTYTSVAQPDHPLFFRWDKQRFLEVQTPIKKMTTADAINIWYIIAGVLGGLILLAFIAVLAWRLGFFKRTDKAKLEKLKRQSGFYQTKQGSRRSNRASTGGSQRSAGSVRRPDDSSDKK